MRDAPSLKPDPIAAPIVTAIPTAAPQQPACPAPRISVVIPTFRRQRSLRRALLSVEAQRGLSADEFEVVVIDNCPARTAESTVNRIAGGSRLRVEYACEPTPGVSAARNRGVALARGELIAFLDDDEDAEPGWLAALVAAQRATGCDAVFGAVVGKFDGPPRADAGLHEAQLSRLFPEPAGPVPSRRVAALGSGNSLFHRRCLSGPEPFDPALGLCGGEDSALIRKLRLEGRSLGWCPQARVKEFFTQERLTLRYLLKRRFSSGQTRTSLCTSNRPEAVKWMMVGLVQLLLGATLAVAAVPVQTRVARQGLCLASGGLGKVLWMPPFRALHAPARKKSP